MSILSFDVKTYWQEENHKQESQRLVDRRNMAARISLIFGVLTIIMNYFSLYGFVFFGLSFVFLFFAYIAISLDEQIKET